jgi:hypothetical protein
VPHTLLGLARACGSDLWSPLLASLLDDVEFPSEDHDEDDGPADPVDISLRLDTDARPTVELEAQKLPLMSVSACFACCMALSCLRPFTPVDCLMHIAPIPYIPSTCLRRRPLNCGSVLRMCQYTGVFRRPSLFLKTLSRISQPWTSTQPSGPKHPRFSSSRVAVTHCNVY